MKNKLLFIVSIIALFFINIKSVNALINIKQDSFIIGIDYSQALTVTGENGNVTWKSSDTNIVTVSNGKITGVSEGTAYVSATDGKSTDLCKITVISYYVPVKDLTLSKSSETLSLNGTTKIVANIQPSNASNKKIYYLSQDSSIASVDENGNVTAKKEGSTYISVNVENKTRLFKVIVVKNLTVSLKSISITQNISLNEGETKRINVTYNPSNASNKKVSWKSSNTGVVTVDENGNVKGISPGSATITATSNDGNHIATSKITVLKVDKSLKSISLNKTELELKIGNEETLVVNFEPSNAENKKISWSSSKDEVVTVDNGKIKALKPGTAEIKVVSDDGKKEAVCKVKVLSLPIESISFKDETIEVYVGNTATLVTKSVPENTAIEDPIWTSSDDEVASVRDGVVTAKSVGVTTITISDKEKKVMASMQVIVNEKPEEKLLITVDGYDLNFDIDTKNYTLLIGNESSLNIVVNRDSSKYVIGGNRDLKNGSIITVTVNDKTKTTYVINIKKKQNYLIYFIGIISVLLFINIIRLIKNNKRKNKE